MMHRIACEHPAPDSSLRNIGHHGLWGAVLPTNHPHWSISALARRFRVARRTILRDLRALIRRGQLPPEAYPDAADDASGKPGRESDESET